MENYLMTKFLNAEEGKLDADFCSALVDFGVDHRFVESYQHRQDPLDGWSFGEAPIPTETHEKADAFLRCIELEERLEQEKDPQKKKEMQLEILELQRQTSLNL
eukprot:TRINITY_DN3865_c0_g1_i2.p1 TRINITY_DN3865_c0_g1~~TRINITY_DN3865_c0_g1_i2.p1  ORF type:complete len:104 (-),score=9.53 TRINITY_DN3865_c0_g1_i2:68-379(-)